jgi:hypothetical protein
LSRTEPQLGDLAEFLCALALGALGALEVPGENPPLDRDRARWLIGLLETLQANIRADADAAQTARVDAALAHIRMIYVEGA